jgi:predicted TIM-barrel fold metal-dependent hydrolase
LIDVHAHFHSHRSSRGDWEELNASRLRAGATMGITAHVASVLGTWGARSPTYFPSPEDVTHANTYMAELADQHAGLIYAYCAVNPNYTEHALRELERCFGQGVIGVKLAASRRADDPLLDPIAEFAAAHDAPILHHIWQHRRREWLGQEASDAAELLTLAARHPDTKFLLAHIGGGGDWAHTLRVVDGVENVWIDLSGSGVDTGMLEGVLEAVGVKRAVWGCDVTMDTGLAKLRYLERLGLDAGDVSAIRSGNARDVFPPGAFAT